LDALKIDGTQDSPNVILDPENNDFQFTGMSLPENATAFYDPIMDWLNNYAVAPNQETKVVIKLDYFNTASSKILLNIFLILEEMNKSGIKVLVSWHYREEDEEMKEAGEEFKDMMEVPFELTPFK